MSNEPKMGDAQRLRIIRMMLLGRINTPELKALLTPVVDFANKTDEESQ